MWIHSGPEPTTVHAAAPTGTVALAVPAMLMAEGLARLLLDHGMRVVGCCATHAALLELVALRAVDLIVLDTDLLAAADGPERPLAALRTAAPASRVVVLADGVDCALAAAMLDCGAHGLILKSSPTADAVATLVQVFHGGSAR